MQISKADILTAITNFQLAEYALYLDAVLSPYEHIHLCSRLEYMQGVVKASAKDIYEVNE